MASENYFGGQVSSAQKKFWRMTSEKANLLSSRRHPAAVAVAAVASENYFGGQVSSAQNKFWRMTSENYFQRQLFSAQTKFWRVDSDNYFPAQHICASLCLMRRAHRVEVCGGAGGARQHHHKSLPHPSPSPPFSRTHRPPALTPRRFSPTIAAGSRIGLVERPCRFKPTSFDPV